MKTGALQVELRLKGLSRLLNHVRRHLWYFCTPHFSKLSLSQASACRAFGLRESDEALLDHLTVLAEFRVRPAAYENRHLHNLIPGIVPLAAVSEAEDWKWLVCKDNRAGNQYVT